jgi:proliferating cell nuclear antigen
MKFKVIDARSFSYIMRVISEFLDESNITANKEGLLVAGVDPSKSVYLEIFLPNGYFENYEISEEQEVVGFNMEEMIEVLKKVTKEDYLHIETSKDKIKIIMEGEYERYFEIPIIVAAKQELPTMNLELPYRAKMLSSVFADIIDELSDLGDKIIFETKEGKLYIKAEGDMGISTIELSTENGGLLESEGSDVSGIYSMEYILNTIKMRNSSDTLEIKFGTQLPIRLRYELPQGGYGDFYIAPRAE